MLSYIHTFAREICLFKDRSICYHCPNYELCKGYKNSIFNKTCHECYKVDYLKCINFNTCYNLKYKIEYVLCKDCYTDKYYSKTSKFKTSKRNPPNLVIAFKSEPKFPTSYNCICDLSTDFCKKCWDSIYSLPVINFKIDDNINLTLDDY